MTQQSSHSALGVVARSSVDYLRIMLGALTDGTVTVPLRDKSDNERLDRGNVAKVIDPQEGGGWLEHSFTSEGGDDLAMISFTSGTEGPPKAVYLSKENLHDVVRRLQDQMQLSDDVREYIGVPVYHSFGYGRARAVLNAKGACYLPQKGFDLLEIRGMLRDQEINAISAVPSLWRIFLQQRDLFGSELENVRWVEIGSQHMSAEDKIALREALPNACIVQHYGLTEASRSTFLPIHALQGEALASIGSANGNTKIRLNDDGRICIAGPHVALGVEDGGAYKELKPNAWFETSDLGREENGLIFFEGRADDIININGLKLSPDLMEGHVREAMPDIGDFGILRWPDPLRGDGVMLTTTPDTHDETAAIIEAIGDYADSVGVTLGNSISTSEAQSLPRTATGKLERKKLQDILQKQETDTSQPTGFEAFLKDILGEGIQNDSATFASMNGDSLAHMQVTLMLERSLGNVPASWEWTPLSELIAQVNAAGDYQDFMNAPSGAPPLPDGSRNENPSDIGFWSLVREDYHSNGSSVFHQGFLMLFVHRFGNWRMSVRPKLIRAPLTLVYRFLNKLTQLFFGMKLDYTVKVGRRVRLEHFGGMIFGAREIQDDVILRQNTTFGIRSVEDLSAKPTIGARVDVGAGAVIVGNITIGADSIIGSNSVVYTNIPPGSVVMGVPAKIIGKNPKSK